MSDGNRHRYKYIYTHYSLTHIFTHTVLSWSKINTEINHTWNYLQFLLPLAWCCYNRNLLLYVTLWRSAITYYSAIVSCLCYSLISLSTATKPETDLQSMPAVIKAQKTVCQGIVGLIVVARVRGPRDLSRAPSQVSSLQFLHFQWAEARSSPTSPVHLSNTLLVYIYIYSIRSIYCLDESVWSS